MKEKKKKSRDHFTCKDQSHIRYKKEGMLSLIWHGNKDSMMTIRHSLGQS
jgi:hypothetical protein